MSSRSPREPLSLTVSTAATMRLFFISTMPLPGATLPPSTTLAKMPSRGITQSPAWWKIAQRS